MLLRALFIRAYLDNVTLANCVARVLASLKKAVNNSPHLSLPSGYDYRIGLRCFRILILQHFYVVRDNREL